MIERGRLALPDFQRDFVWKADSVIELVESVANGWPVGTLLFIEAPQPMPYKALESGPSIETLRPDYLLLDGQQRLTSLYQALTGSGATQYWVDFDDLDEFGLPVLKHTKRKNWRIDTSSSMTLSSYADSTYFNLSAKYLSPDARDIALRSRVKQMAGLLDDEYRLSATVLEKATQPADLAQIFETLNRTGTRLDTFDLTVAATYDPPFSLRNEWSEAQKRFPVLKGYEVDGIEILRLIALEERSAEMGALSRSGAIRTTGIRQSDVLALPPSKIRAAWAEAVESYARALLFMESEFGLRDKQSLPSRTMLLAISHWLRRGETNLNSWYWSSIVTESYAQGANTRVITDTRAERPFAALSVNWREKFEQRLLNPDRGSRMLRAALRGLIITEGARDVVSGRQLKGPVREIFPSAWGSASPLASAIWYPADTASRTRRHLAQSNFGGDLRDALQSQGIASLSFDEPALRARARWLADRIEEKI